jgi:hypothetical protein
MKKMLAGFLVLFAVCSLSLTLIPSTHSQTSNIKVLNYSHYVDSLGYLVVVGEIQNIGTNTITSVVLTGAVTSSDGSVTNSYAQVWVSNLIPQQKAPFYMEFNSQSGVNWQTDITDIAIAVYQADATANYLYPDLTITSQVGSVSPDGVFWVNGQIQNTGSQTAKNVTIVGTFYNSTGQVVAVGYSDKTTMNPFSLEPQQSGTFKLGAFDLNQTIVPAEMKISTYSLLIQPLGPILTGAAPVIPVTATPPPITVATPGPTNSQSGSNPSGSMPQWIYGAVAVIAIAVVAVAILTLMNRKKPQLATQTKNKPVKTAKRSPKPSSRPNR